MREYYAKRGIEDRLSEMLSADGLLDMMEQNGIDKSVVSAIPITSGLQNTELDFFNTYVYREVQKAGNRLVGFCTVDPRDGEGSLALVRKWIEEKGFKGLKLHPSFQEFYPDSDLLDPLYSYLQRKGLPVLFHSGVIGVEPFQDKYSAAVNFDGVANKYPELKIILGHAGRPMYDQVASLLRKHKNMSADISANVGRLKELEFKPLQWLLYRVKIYTGGFDGILFGSDYPFYFQNTMIDVLEKTVQALNAENPGFVGADDLEKINRNNSEMLFCGDL
jgi:uncharacterized protein